MVTILMVRGELIIYLITVPEIYGARFIFCVKSTTTYIYPSESSRVIRFHSAYLHE